MSVMMMETMMIMMKAKKPASVKKEVKNTEKNDLLFIENMMLVDEPV